MDFVICNWQYDLFLSAYSIWHCSENVCINHAVFRNLHIPSLHDWNCYSAYRRDFRLELFYVCNSGGCFINFPCLQRTATHERNQSERRRMPKKPNKYNKNGRRARKEKRRGSETHRSFEWTSNNTIPGEFGTAPNFSDPNSEIERVRA